MPLLEIAVALVGVACLIVNRSIDQAVERFVEERRKLPSPPTGLVLDKHTRFVLGVHDWDNVIFWSFINESDARYTFDRVRLRRVLYRATQLDTDTDTTDISTAATWEVVDSAGYNRRVDRVILSALHTRTKELRSLARSERVAHADRRTHQNEPNLCRPPPTQQVHPLHTTPHVTHAPEQFAKSPA